MDAIKSFSDVVLLPTERDVLRVHLYFKMIQYGIRPFEKDLDIIIELYLFGGYHSPETQRDFIRVCLDKKLKRSAQSLRNTFSKYVSLGVLYKTRKAHLSVSEQFIPSVAFRKLMLEHKISHAN